MNNRKIPPVDDPLVCRTVELYQGLKEVDAIALGGSRASGAYDADSDYDLYVYINHDLTAARRRDVLSQTCKYMEIDNSYWEPEDDCVLNNGVFLEVIYRSIGNTCQSLENTLEKHIAGNGYTTCICYNVFNSIPLYDPKGLYGGMVKRYTMPYPEALRKNILTRGRELLEGKIPSYVNQIEKAVKRNDIVSVHHRITEMLASYFDILFAFNRQFHPGEKRMVELSKKLCPALPGDFEKDIADLLTPAGKEEIMPAVKRLISNLDELMAIS